MPLLARLAVKGGMPRRGIRGEEEEEELLPKQAKGSEKGLLRRVKQASRESHGMLELPLLLLLRLLFSCPLVAS